MPRQLWLDMLRLLRLDMQQGLRSRARRRASQARRAWYRCSSHSVGTGARHSHSSKPSSRASTDSTADLPHPGGPAARGAEGHGRQASLAAALTVLLHPPLACGALDAEHRLKLHADKNNSSRMSGMHALLKA